VFEWYRVIVVNNSVSIENGGRGEKISRRKKQKGGDGIEQVTN
jgi:hypothetical protein